MLAAIYNKLAAASGQPNVKSAPSVSDVDGLVQNLLEHKGKSVVISGSNDPAVQKMVAGINYMLGNYGSTLDLERCIHVKRGDDRRFWASCRNWPPVVLITCS